MSTEPQHCTSPAYCGCPRAKNPGDNYSEEIKLVSPVWGTAKMIACQQGRNRRGRYSLCPQHACSDKASLSLWFSPWHIWPHFVAVYNLSRSKPVSPVMTDNTSPVLLCTALSPCLLWTQPPHASIPFCSLTHLKTSGSLGSLALQTVKTPPLYRPP